MKKFIIEVELRSYVTYMVEALDAKEVAEVATYSVISSVEVGP